MARHLSIDVHGRLTITTPTGEQWADVTPVRCFPLSAGDGWVAFVDPQGRERWLLEQPETLEADDRALLAAELRRREFLPRIQRIRDIRPRTDPATWEVETDRGPATFVLDTRA